MNVINDCEFNVNDNKNSKIRYNDDDDDDKLMLEEANLNDRQLDMNRNNGNWKLANSTTVL